MTHVVDIMELYKLVPEAQFELEGRSFSDIKQVLTSLIKALEKTGKWEFVQYVSNKPALYIIRDVANKPVFYENVKNDTLETKKNTLKRASKTLEEKFEPIEEVVPVITELPKASFPWKK